MIIKIRFVPGAGVIRLWESLRGESAKCGSC